MAMNTQGVGRTGGITPRQIPKITERSSAKGLENWGRTVGFATVMRNLDKLSEEAQEIAISACTDKPGF